MPPIPPAPPTKNPRNNRGFFVGGAGGVGGMGLRPRQGPCPRHPRKGQRPLTPFRGPCHIASMVDPAQIFDRTVVRKHRDRAATTFAAHDFLVREAAERLSERLEETLHTFPLVLDLGCHTGLLADLAITRGGAKTVIQTDMSLAMATTAASTGHPVVVADEEWLPFAPESFDAVLSCLSLHWVNDLPGTLVQIKRILKPGGLFLAAMLGGETLRELRQALAEAEINQEGGLSPRVSPFADVRDLGGLLQRAGFAHPMVDMDSLTVSYADPFRLLSDLRGMGETNALRHRRKTPLRRQTLFHALHLYREAFAGAVDGRVPATFQILTLTGWNEPKDAS